MGKNKGLKLMAFLPLLVIPIYFLISTHQAHAISPITVTGVAINNSSVKIYFNPVAGASDYRVYDLANPTNVKYAGMRHLIVPNYCNCHFVMQADGVTPVFPYATTANKNGVNLPTALDLPSTEIEWNKIEDQQPHTLIVEALNVLGPVPQYNLYNSNSTPLYPNSANMLGANQGLSTDGNISTNGQGAFTNGPQVIAQSQPFVVSSNPNLVAIPSVSDATQTFFDTFEDSQATSLVQTVAPNNSKGTMAYSLNAGTPKEWGITYQNADVKNSMPMILSGHFMDILFDGGTPGSNNPLHISYGVMAMSPTQPVDISNGQLYHLTMEVDAHQSSRRWMQIYLVPANDPIKNFQFGQSTNQPINNSDLAFTAHITPGGCVVGTFIGPISSTNTSPQGNAIAGAAGQAKYNCSNTTIDWGGNGLGLDNRSKIDLFLTQNRYALFVNGKLINQEPISPALTFSQIKTYFTHYNYHSALGKQELTQYSPYEDYWINQFAYSDERHWDNMGFEVLPTTDIPNLNDFSNLTRYIIMPQTVIPTFATPAPSPTASPVPTDSPTPLPTASPTPTLTPSPNPASGSATQP